MIRRLYDWTMNLAGHRHSGWALAGVSFIESSVFPIPPDVLLAPMVLARREKAWIYAGLCTGASVLGGFFGYAIGFFLFETIGQSILAFYGLNDSFARFSESYNQWGVWIVLMAGITPFPYKVITIASGVTGLNPVVFGFASLVARAARFYLVAGLLWKFGPPIRGFVEKNLGWVATGGFALLLGGFMAVKLWL